MDFIVSRQARSNYGLWASKALTCVPQPRHGFSEMMIIVVAIILDWLSCSTDCCRLSRRIYIFYIATNLQYDTPTSRYILNGNASYAAKCLVRNNLLAQHAAFVPSLPAFVVPWDRISIPFPTFNHIHIACD